MATEQEISQLLADRPLPCAWIDATRLQENIQQLADAAAPLKIRLASKSIRCKEVLKRLLHDYPQIFHGVLAYHPDEAVWLSQHGIDDIVVGYPYVRWFYGPIPPDVRWDSITFMVDRAQHLQAISHLAARLNRSLNICFDIDLSTSHFGLHFGVHRSALKDQTSMSLILDRLDEFPLLKLVGVMGYEAQIAGVGEANPFKRALNPVVALLKKQSWPQVCKRRQALVKLCRERGHQLRFVNGGGTGSLRLTTQDSSVTEVAAGSGLFSPLLFDYYRDFKLTAAAGFALELTRHPRQNIYTAAGGGYIASGSAGADKLPRPVAHDCSLDNNEGAGEVQTPLHTKSSLQLGQPILFRHAKAGEMCERFNQLLWLENNRVTPMLTYRGEGQCFL